MCIRDRTEAMTEAPERTSFRQIYFKTGVVSRAAGSAYAENAGTKVIVAVYGPRQMPTSEFSALGKLKCDFKVAPFGSTTAPNRWTAEEEDRDARSLRELQCQEAASLLEQALEPSIRLELYPKSLIEVHALVLQSDGSALAITTTAASLALADAGVELFDMVAACSVAHDQEGLVLDPTAAEERAADASVLLGYMPSLDETTQMMQQGKCSQEALQQGVELGLDGCSKIHGLMRSTLLKKNAEA
eukprot:TRINITY_DN10518_c0_g1_i1.p1 TRINITY_DN10518_c0_g1~~TRINITY_DN10518_c0_g1_i1.p1  ORF type:complete len:245 (-),score=65.89 TRINITY_DN10518_c0_g1_i1:278-1012(-)